MPLRGIIGSDLLRVRPDWTVIDNPYGEDDPIVLLPALRPDAAVFHAALADQQGNVWVGRRGELKTMAHAAKGSCVTVERIYDGDLLEDDRYAAGTIPAMYVEAAAEAADGAWPCAFWDGERPADAAHLRRYAELARTDEGFARYLDEFVYGRRAAA
jgi:glutaconate CoA-transferase subunit A